MISLINNMMRSSSGHYTIDASQLIVTEILSGNIDCMRVFPLLCVQSRTIIVILNQYSPKRMLFFLYWLTLHLYMTANRRLLKFLLFSWCNFCIGVMSVHSARYFDKILDNVLIKFLTQMLQVHTAQFVRPTLASADRSVSPVQGTSSSPGSIRKRLPAEKNR